MRDIRTQCAIKRYQILRDEVLSLAQIGDLFLRRANREGVPDERAVKLLNYILSFEAFQELESYWFWYYDPAAPAQWYKILDHVYRRSITPNHLMN